MGNMMTLQETADFTRLAPSTLYKYVSSRRIPFVRIGTKLLFSRDVIEEWIMAQAVEPIGVRK